MCNEYNGFIFIIKNGKKTTTENNNIYYFVWRLNFLIFNIWCLLLIKQYLNLAFAKKNKYFFHKTIFKLLFVLTYRRISNLQFPARYLARSKPSIYLYTTKIL